jgi:8-oxo-dGTP pyrophosphatase MutT (NUDIX family)/RNA:NAD 2'-phosphotransferase (TPT1/KptA family)/GNAT superfamily N-acetyltransferase
MPKKVELIKTPGFVIEVPKERRKTFFVRPKTPLEYWAFKNRPRVFLNEQIIFTFGGKPMAEALVVKIEGPGTGEGEYKHYHKVYWKPSRFRKFRVTAAEDPFLYHVTLQKNVDDIMENGLKAEYGYQLFEDTPRSTFLTERKGLNFWKNEIADYYGDPVAVVKVPRAGLNLIPDEQGTHDAGGTPAYRVEQDIPAAIIKQANSTKKAEMTEEPDYYMTEGCGIFAVDFARKNGGEIYIMAADRGEEWSDEIPYEVTHAFVKKDGKTFDIRGERTPDKMAWELSMGGYSIKGPWTPDAFEAKFMGGSDDKPLYGNTIAAKTADWDEEEEDYDPSAEEDPAHYYAHGACFVYAVALNKLTGWPIFTIGDPEEGAALHSVVKKPNGKFFDSKGESTLQQLGKRYGLRKPFAEPITPEGASELALVDTGMDEEDFELKDALAAARLQLGMKTASITSQLQSLMQQDQQERKYYEDNYESKYPDWREAAKAYAKDKGRPTDDIFGDGPRLLKAKQLIQSSMQQIIADPKALHDAWLLVQHMDKDVAFQKEFLKHLKPGTQDFKYLTDRVAVNSGQPQQFGTQNVNAAAKTADQIIDVGEGDEYWAGEGNAASGILPVCPQKGTVCLAWRSQYVMTPHCWGTIGGAVQKGKSPQESAKAELKEETGYSGGMNLIPAYVFTDRAFTYHNYIGVTSTEFSFAPKPYSREELAEMKKRLSPEQSYQLVPGWETDHIEWVPYATVIDDMNENPEDYHPGMLKLFKNSKDAIERALGIENKGEPSGSKQGAKVKREPFWFQPGFDPKIKAFILKNRFPNEGISCWDESYRWAEKLLRQGYDVDLYGGMYTGEEDLPLFPDDADNPDDWIDHGRMEGHTWLAVNGYIFDPTARQFNSEPDSDYYKDDSWEDAEELKRKFKIAEMNPTAPVPDASRRPCPSGKRKFFDATTVLQNFRNLPIPPRAYQCPMCGWFHLTSKPQKQAAGEQGHLFPSSQDAKFRQWFNGSKVVDKNGNPMPVYHGTRSSVEFDEFAVDGPPQVEDSYEGETTSSGSGADPTAFIGAHFAEEANVANQFAQGTGWTKSRYEGEAEKPRVIQVFLRITNPKDFGGEENLRNFIYQGKISDDEVLGMGCRSETEYNPWEGEDDPEVQKKIEDYFQKYENDQSFRAGQNEFLLEHYRPMDMEEEYLRNAAYELAMEARRKLEAAGHDGVRYKNIVEGGHAWVAFAANQIKSAYAQEFNPKDPRFTASKTAAPLHEEGKKRQFFHGTDKEELARKIMQEGIQPRMVIDPAKAKSRAQLAPVPDRVYMTTSFGYAAIYAVGGSVFGSKSMEFLKGKDPFGYVFETEGSALQGDVTPDEDSIGEWMSFMVGYDDDKRKFEDWTSRVKAGKPLNEYEKGQYERYKKEGIPYHDQAINKPGAEDARSHFRWMFGNFLTEKQKWSMHYNPDIGILAVVGKKLQKRMTPEVTQFMLDNGAHAAHQGAVHPTKAWKIDKEKAVMIGGEMENWATEVPMTASVTASDYELAQKLGLWFSESKEADWKSKVVLPTALALGLGAPSAAPTREALPPISAPAVREKQVTLDELVEAIRRAEGADPDLHNPGNLVGFHSGEIMQFQNDAQGVHALKNALKRIADGKNPAFAPDLTLEEAGKVYSNGDPNWAKNVSQILGVDPQTPFVKLIKGKGKVAATFPTQTEPQPATNEHPDVMYHYAGTENRASIQEHGLLGSKSSAIENAVFLDSKLTQEGKYTDTWEVNVKGLELESDWTTDISDRDEWEGHTWWIFYGDIPPQRLKLVHEGRMATASWVKRAAGFAFKSFKKLWHVGTMNPKDKRDDSYEGAGLSVSVNPEEWSMIAKLPGSYWEFTKPGNKFVNFHRLSKAQKQQIVKWGIKNGYAQPAQLWRHEWYNDEIDDWQYSDYPTKAEAEGELGSYGPEEKVTPVKGGLNATPKLSQKSLRGKIDPTEVMDLLVAAYAEDELDCDGVWWDDTLDPENLSAPRGVIFPSKLPSWKKRKAGRGAKLAAVGKPSIVSHWSEGFNVEFHNDKGVRVGLLQIDTQGTTGVVKAIDVNEDYQRQGIATKLYAAARIELKKRGIKVLKGALEGSGPVQIREKVFGPGKTKYYGGGGEINAEEAIKVMDVDYGYTRAETRIAAGETFLYHGTNTERLPSILKDGMPAPNFWGTEDMAFWFSKGASEEEGLPVVLRLPLSRFNQSALAVDNVAIQEPITEAIGRDEEELYAEWEAVPGEGTWQDSLRIYHSVKYNAPIKIEQKDVWYDNSKAASMAVK